MTDLDLTADIIDVRDIIARVESLEGDAEAFRPGSDEAAELEELTDILADLAGGGGDEDWRGDWYPVTLIRDSYFRTYAQELVEDCGYISGDLPSWIEIDWNATARNVRMDYTSVEIDGVTYWYR